ncbi:MAG: hypothetical protein LBT46_12510 [Planctomycetaceae bacterium]|jgi:hypothetical protein|nr:hypothetical protein [Planctomycetaceae bacterium]
MDSVFGGKYLAGSNFDRCPLGSGYQLTDSFTGSQSKTAEFEQLFQNQGLQTFFGVHWGNKSRMLRRIITYSLPSLNRGNMCQRQIIFYRYLCILLVHLRWLFP